MIEYHTVKYDGRDLRLFKSISNERLKEEGETFEEYRIRIHFANKQIKDRKKFGIDFQYGK